jgi:hypothetical protein
VARPTVTVLGMMGRHPYGGVVWQTLHYLVGLRQLGCDVVYLETHGQNPSLFTAEPGEDGTKQACVFLDEVLEPYGLGDRWAYRPLHADTVWHGPADPDRALRDADVVLNLHGATRPELVEEAAGRLVYVETDPVAVQVELSQNVASTAEYLAAHAALFTFAETYGTPACGLPRSPDFAFLPTRQPVVLDLWDDHDLPDSGVYTTIGNWRQRGRDVVLDGETYTWSKHHEFLKIVDLPQRTSARLKLAVTSCPQPDRQLLKDNGWLLVDALGRSREPRRYRRFIQSSRGELTVAKDQNVRLRTGWFSDRSATYLAAGRPVVTQDTGFGEVLPTGAGLLAFTDVEEAAEAIERIEVDYARHRAAARQVARECFAHDVVLKPLLAEVGL